jgi:seryl-tRNA synthetase
MLDLKFVRENLDKVRAALEARQNPTNALDEFNELDSARRR